MRRAIFLGQFWAANRTAYQQLKSDSSDTERNGYGFETSEEPSASVAPTSVQDRYELLELAASAGKLAEVERLVKDLMLKDGERPNLKLYTALIKANVSAENGSAEVVASIRREMEEAKISPDSGTYHAMLKTLAIHPDFQLRNQILQEMRHHWVELTAEGWCDVTISLLREQNIELALQNLDHIIQEEIAVPNWLYDSFIYTLLELEEVNEAMGIIRNRSTDSPKSISATAWFQLLAVASQALHLEGTNYVWRSRVKAGFLIPTDGMCLNILDTAARHGDQDLATDVIEMIRSREMSLTTDLYETLIETYAKSGDIEKALAVLCEMSDNGGNPGQMSTVPISEALGQDPERPLAAFEHLRKLRDARSVVPSAAIACIIDSFLNIEDLDTALDCYKLFYTKSSSKPEVGVFNALIKGCRISGRKDIAFFLASEMVELGVEPDSITYDRLVLVCAKCPDEVGGYDDAFRYFDEMKRRGFVPRNGTYLQLLQNCAQAQDSRFWMLLEEVEASGMKIDKYKDGLVNAMTAKPGGTNKSK
ncbi:MAG: RNA processing protein [Chaenotheca gracillima]|nr:MAG: RNA processing protein [Chaenotheca gracillima]